MKIPLNWLEKYIKLEHSPKEFGDIMTKLEFMQDGLIEEIKEEKVIDLEIRQNRPDLLSVIGAAREYAAYIDKEITYPEELSDIDTEWGKPDTNLSVAAKDVVKRFCTVEIKNIRIESSPKWMIDHLEAYGIPAVNNLVDITNYVMLEYGYPLHAFDKSKLSLSEDSSLLTVRKSDEGETFTTWQGTNIKLSKDDIVVADSEKPVAIAGIIGGANSDIDNNTKDIILECAVYDHASIRKTSIKHGIRTEASLRHEKFLNPNMVEIAIRRALFLIKDLCNGEIVKIEDFYEKRVESVKVDFNMFEIERLGGVQIEQTEIISLLKRLGFAVLDQKEAIGLDKNILTIKVPNWRTDVNIQADVVEEVLRLWGYEKIPQIPLSTTPPDYSTPAYIQLEEKIRDILVNLGLDEYITNPLVEYNKNDSNQIELENPLNNFQNALRTNLKSTLKEVISFNKKAGRDRCAIFEVGKIYYKRRVGEFLEKRAIQSLYDGYDFEVIKADFISLMNKLGVNNKLQWKLDDNKLIYNINDSIVAILYHDGYELFPDEITEFVKIKEIPTLNFQTGITQRILEEISLVIENNESLGKVASIISSASDYIKSVEIGDIYEDAKLGVDKVSTNFQILFEDTENKLTREKIESIKQEMLNTLQTRIGAYLRK